MYYFRDLIAMPLTVRHCPGLSSQFFFFPESSRSTAARTKKRYKLSDLPLYNSLFENHLPAQVDVKKKKERGNRKDRRPVTMAI